MLSAMASRISASSRVEVLIKSDIRYDGAREDGTWSLGSANVSRAQAIGRRLADPRELAVVRMMERLRIGRARSLLCLRHMSAVVRRDQHRDPKRQVLKASSRNGFEQIPFVVTPRSADNSKPVASLAACPKAMTVCPREWRWS